MTLPQFADFVADAVLATDARYRITYWNEAAVRLFGWRADEVTGRHALDLLHVTFEGSSLEAATRSMAETGWWSGVVTQVARDGRTLTCEASVTRLPEGDGHVVVTRDLAERQRLIDARQEAEERVAAALAFEELRETERVLRTSQAELRKLSSVIEHCSSAVIITDRSGRIEYVNPSFSAMSGYAPEEVIGQNPRLFKSRETADDAYRLLWSTISSGRTWRGELRNRSKAGVLYWLRAAIAPIFDERGTITHFVAIEEHIGAQKAAEDAAVESERKFLRAQKMEAVGQLASGIAHDFNNLLTVILGYSGFVLGALRGEPALTQDVEEIRKAGERAAGLTRQLLAFSRRQRLEPQNVDLSHIVRDVAQMVARVIGENIHLTVATDDTLGLARLDPGQTEQVVMNLVVNARDAMPKGGRLEIRTANADLGDEFVKTHPGARAGPYVVLTVSDTGTGMPPEIVAHVFEPFFTTKALGQGTGLGLATVYGIVKQSNGYITVDSHVGTGTTFTIYFPRLGAEIMPTAIEAIVVEQLKGHETILVAEDEADLRHVVQRVLEQHGYTVLLASNGTAALTVEQNHVAPIDLLLSDVVMPELGGADLARRLVRRRPLMKVLYMSGFDDHALDALESVGSPVAFLSKPFTPEALARKVREVLNRP